MSHLNSSHRCSSCLLRSTTDWHLQHLKDVSHLEGSSIPFDLRVFLWASKHLRERQYLKQSGHSPPSPLTKEQGLCK